MTETTPKFGPGWQKNINSAAEAAAYLYGEEYDADVLILVGKNKEPILAHKFILMIRSSVFEAALKDDAQVKHETYNGKSYIALEALNMEPESFRVFLKFLYMDKLDTNSENVQGVISAAERYKVQEAEERIRLEFPLRVIKLNQDDLRLKKFRLKYHIFDDVYCRGIDRPGSVILGTNSRLHLNELIDGWSSLVYSMKNMDRKEENDWRMLYLCRKPGTDYGELAWRIDLTGLEIKCIKVHLGNVDTWECGKIRASVRIGDQRFECPPSSDGSSTTDDAGYATHVTMRANWVIKNVRRSDYMLVRVEFSGGSSHPTYGNIAFQQSQLFRTSMNAPKMNMLVEIDLV